MLALLAQSALFFVISRIGADAVDSGFVKWSHQPIGKRALASYSHTAWCPPRVLAGQQQGHKQQPITTLRTKTRDMETDLALTKQITLPVAVVNLIKACTGAGCMCLSGTASSSGTGLGSSLAIYLITALGCAWSFSMVGLACEAAERNGALRGSDVSDFRNVWSAIIGHRSSFVVDVFQVLYATLCCACYLPTLHAFMVPALLALGVPQTITALPLKLGLAVVLIGLSRLRNLKDVAPISALGVAGFVCTCAMVIWRSLDGSYALLGPFSFSTSITQQPSFWALGPASFSLYLASTFSLSAHYSAPRFYGQLQRRSGRRFQILSGSGFVFLAATYMLLNIGTFATFGGVVQAPLINSYATGDPLALACRCLFLIALLGIYPLVFMAIWDPMARLLATARSAMWRGSVAREFISLEGAVGLVSVAVVATSLCIRNIGSAYVKAGAITSPAFCWIFPGMLALSAGKRWGYRNHSQGVLCRAAIVWGSVQAVLGILLS
mmetsp:Transcript_131137/g.261739  ORF Transcript_131137/g.261739 Transcript_131137/m.261739 type:complete len:496 (+) Transcript_131137:78-1565(+)